MEALGGGSDVSQCFFVYLVHTLSIYHGNSGSVITTASQSSKISTGSVRAPAHSKTTNPFQFNKRLEISKKRMEGEQVEVAVSGNEGEQIVVLGKRCYIGNLA